MFGFLNSFLLSIKNKKINKNILYNELYSKIRNIYYREEISFERKKELSSLIEKYGYLPYSQIKAIKELSPSEVIFCLEKKLEINKTIKNGKLNIENNKISALQRLGVQNSNWIKKEQHEIKLINLAALGDGLTDLSPAKFIDWLRQIIILPSGNLEKNILPATVYLVPFTPRDFGNAYILAGTKEISSKLEDKLLKDEGITVKESVKLFITLAQLCNHPVIYDCVPQMGRFAKTILSNPKLVRWVDVNFMIEEISKSLNSIAQKLSVEFDEDDITIVKNIYKTTLKSGSCDLSSEFMPIYNRFNEELESKRKELTNFITTYEQQKILQERVQNIVAKIEGTKPNKIKNDNDIHRRGEIINTLINEGLWTIPQGTYCSSGLPVFEKMSEGGAYPIFLHYNSKGVNVSEFADSDCETPFYFVCLENGNYNKDVVEYYINYLENLQKDYNFDGFRMSNTDFVVDEMSEENLRPISYRIPRFLLTKLNETLKKKIPYFAVMAEYRLWNSYLKEYHCEMKFDVLWGNDTKTDYEKTPVEVIEDNRELQNYNNSLNNLNSPLTVLKTYNNQDGEFRTINRYVGLQDREEALFKWFKFRFLPGGKYAQRPILYCDGDESFSKDGIDSTIKEEISLMRNNDDDFYDRFDAIRRFAINNELTTDGESQIINKNNDGFICWMISKETVKECLIIAADYFPKHEKLLKLDKNGIAQYDIKKHDTVKNKKIAIPSDFYLYSEYIYEQDKKDFVEHYLNRNIKSIEIKSLNPSEFRIYKIKR